MITLPSTQGDIFLDSAADVTSYTALPMNRTLLTVTGGAQATLTMSVREFEALLEDE